MCPAMQHTSVTMEAKQEVFFSECVLGTDDQEDKKNANKVETSSLPPPCLSLCVCVLKKTLFSCVRGASLDTAPGTTGNEPQSPNAACVCFLARFETPF